MKEIIDRIQKIKSNYVELYTDFDKKTVMKNSGKIPGEIDNEYLDFLKITNGASILDYCFLGLKNNKLGGNVYDLMMDLWKENNLLSLRYWGIVGTSTSEYFGYLDKKNNHGGHYIGYYASSNPKSLNLVASSFSIFLKKLIDQVELRIGEDINAFGLNDNGWFLDVGFLVKDDPEMELYVSTVNGNTEYLSTIYSQ